MDNLPKGTHSNIWDKQKQHNQGIGDELWLGEVVAMLNEGVILAEENEQLQQQLKELKEDVPLLLAFYRWYPFAVEKKEHQAYNRLWDFVND